jgi:hypothetical protein
MIKLYVNGDSHTASTYDTNNPLTATEILAKKYNLDYENQALGGGSNQRIIRTTIEQLPQLDPKKTIIVIGWSSFERTEWFYKNKWHQICGDNNYLVDQEIKELSQIHNDTWWKNENKDNWRRITEQHNSIWVFHQLLTNLGYKFLFYQGCNTFFFDGCPEQDLEFKLPWIDGSWIHDPYVSLDRNNQRFIENFSEYSKNKGCQHIDHRAHYGPDAHQYWANYMDPFLNDIIKKLV